MQYIRVICICTYYLLRDDLTIFCITIKILWLFVIPHSGHFERIFSACLRRSAKTFANLYSENNFKSYMEIITFILI